MLIVDDVESNRKYIVECFANTRGLTVYEAGDGNEALNLAKKYHPDVVLMDIKLPGISGNEALQLMKLDDSLNKIPVIAYTASYFEEELNIPVFHKPQQFTFNNTSFFIGHGDGLGPGDKGYKRMKKVFTNPVAKWFYKWLHPDLGVKLAQYLSVKNKLISGDEDIKFLGDEKEWLVQYCQRKLEQSHHDYFVFGHRHLPLEIDLNNKSKYVNLGDWVSHFTYGEYDGEKLFLKKFEN